MNQHKTTRSGLLKKTISSWVLMIIAGLMAGCGSVSNPEDAVNRLDVPPGLSQSQVDTVAAVLSSFPNRTQFSIAFIDDSTTTYYGAIRSNDTLKTISNSDAVFEIGSLSKVFTSAVLADLAYHEKLQLAQPVSYYLDINFREGDDITFTQLANHTSGLPRIPSGFIWESLLHMENPYKDYDEVKVQEYITDEMALKTEPGKTYQYSNIGAGVLGYVLTQIENQSYHALVQEKILQPFNMKSTTTKRNEVRDRLVKGLDKRGRITSYWDFGALQGAGALLSTGEDLTKFARANFNPANEALTLQRNRTFTIDSTRSVALGWFILDRESGDRWYWHNGGTGGFRSSMVLNIEDRKAVVVLSNISAGHTHAADIDQLSFELLESLQSKVTQK